MSFAKLNHLAIVSENFALSSRFYEAYFGMKQAKGYRAEGGAVIGDGYVGMNVNPRVPGRGGRPRAFRLRGDRCTKGARPLKKYPRSNWLKRPSNRPYAGIWRMIPTATCSTSRRRRWRTAWTSMPSRRRQDPSAPISHFGLRTMNPDRMAEFYRDIFELEAAQQAGRRSEPLSDRRPHDHGRHAVEDQRLRRDRHHAASLDHMGFKVENLAKFKEDVERISSRNPYLAPLPARLQPGSPRTQKAPPIIRTVMRSG